MHQKVEFPFGLDSCRGMEPSEEQEIKFQNYFPASPMLKAESRLVPISTDSAQIEEQTKQKMKEFNLETLYEDGKINIYPKKNTVDLKNHLSKKMQKIDKKTEKAIVQIAIGLLKKKQEAKEAKEGQAGAE